MKKSWLYFLIVLINGTHIASNKCLAQSVNTVNILELIKNDHTQLKIFNISEKEFRSFKMGKFSKGRLKTVHYYF